MPVPHERHLPRRTSQDTTGTLSYHAISCPQDMQADGGLMIERRSGTRAATTFRNEPSARPGARASAAKIMELVAPAALDDRDGGHGRVARRHSRQQLHDRREVVQS